MKIYNTLTRKKELFKPIETNKVKMYACGPTVYNYFHIGNARPFVFFDVVRRYFEYIGYQVDYAQNITDIDDKIINLALEQNVNYKSITKKFINAFHEDSAQLNIQKPTFQPKATEFIGQMIGLIRELEQKGFAYESNGDVYFSVEKVESYGELSGRKLDEMKAGARVEENENKKHPADFTLWKASKPGEPSWGSPWGKGRPGWHTECVVMSRDLLGDKIDIHGGGNDLIFPHHENELAQAKASAGDFVNYWMHNGFINIKGEKMSKSKNNFFTARDILRKYDADVIRHFFLSKHYRSPIDFNENIIAESQKAVENFHNALRKAEYLANKDEKIEYSEENNELINKFKSAMDDDFNTAKAISVLFEISTKIKKSENQAECTVWSHLLVEMGSVLGFFDNLEHDLAEVGVDGKTEQLLYLLVKMRNKLKKKKEYDLADEIRQELDLIGIQLNDTADGTEWKVKK